MRKVGVVAVAVLFVSLALTGCLSLDDDRGFDPSSISAPVITYVEQVNNTLPTPMSSFSPAYGMSLSWSITEDIFAGYGGVLDLNLENTNPTGRLYIYGFGIEWVDGPSYFRNCSVYVSHGKEVNLGLLTFGAPSSGPNAYRLVVNLAASNAAGTAWYDLGSVPQDKTQSVSVKKLGTEIDYSVAGNLIEYYDRVNSRVSFTAAASVAEAVREAQPGTYSILQVAEAYEWVHRNIEYTLDGSGDHWQSAEETLRLGTGDCEDHAILMASIIGAMGGSARVNIIEEHAFPTVFVGTTAAHMSQVRDALASYYGLDPASFKVSYLKDDLGYWLVVDTTGFPYAGGIPAQSKPTSSSGEWCIQSSYLYPIDATGTTGGGFLGLF